jgi:hypothetical protein
MDLGAILAVETKRLGKALWSYRIAHPGMVLQQKE